MLRRRSAARARRLSSIPGRWQADPSPTRPPETGQLQEPSSGSSHDLLADLAALGWRQGRRAGGEQPGERTAAGSPPIGSHAQAAGQPDRLCSQHQQVGPAGRPGPAPEAGSGAGCSRPGCSPLQRLAEPWWGVQATCQSATPPSPTHTHAQAGSAQPRGALLARGSRAAGVQPRGAPGAAGSCGRCAARPGEGRCQDRHARQPPGHGAGLPDAEPPAGAHVWHLPHSRLGPARACAAWRCTAASCTPGRALGDTRVPAGRLPRAQGRGRPPDLRHQDHGRQDHGPAAG